MLVVFLRILPAVCYWLSRTEVGRT